MNYRQLEIFRMTMDAGSASAAARMLGLSQPAVSRQLAQIEEELGLDLFAREGGKLRPTAHAQALYDEVAYALEGIERVLNLANRMQGHDAGVLRIAAPFSLGDAVVPRIVARLAAMHRNLRYAVEFARYDAIVRMVARREVDLGIVKEPVSHAGLRNVSLAACRAVCVMPAHHPLARHEEVPVAALAGESLVLVGRDSSWRAELSAMFRAAGKMPTVRVETHFSSAACGLVRCGLGLTVLPELFAAQFAGPDFELRPLAAPIEHRYSVIAPTGLQRARLVDEFVTEARKAIAEILAESRVERRAANSK